MIYEVLLHRTVSQEATVTVDASTEAEAAEIAKARVADDFVAWTQVDEDVRGQVTPAK